MKGLADRLWSVGDLLKERLFRTRVTLPEAWECYYDGRVETVSLERNRVHELSYAY